MQKLLLLLCITVSFIISSKAQSPESKGDSIPDRRQLINWGSDNLAQGLNLANSGKAIQAREYFIKASQELEADLIWEGYIFAQRSLVYTYVGEIDHEKGIEIGWAALEKIKKEAPDYLYLCDDFHQGIGSIYLVSNNSAPSIDVFEQQLSLVQEYYPPDTGWRLGRAYTNLGYAYFFHGEEERGLTYMHTAVSIFEKTNEGENPQLLSGYTINAYQYLADAYYKRGNIEKSITLANKALDFLINIIGENNVQAAKSYHQIGEFYNQINEYELSNTYFNKVVHIINQFGETGDVTTRNLLLISYMAMAANNFNMGATDMASTYYHNALNLIDTYPLGLDPTHKVMILIGLFDCTYNKASYDEALSFLNQADSLKQTLPIHSDAEDTDKWNILWAYARIWEKLRNPDKSQKAYLKLLNAPNAPSQILVHALTEYVDQLIKQHEIDSALYYNKKAILALSTIPDYNDVKTLPEAEELGYFIKTYETLSRRIKLLRRAAYHTDNLILKQDYLEQAALVLQLADDFHIRNLKKSNLLRGTQTETIIEHSLLPYKQALFLMADQYELMPYEILLEKGFFYTQKMKAQQLSLSLLKHKAEAFGNIDTAIIAQERDLLADINYYELKIRLAERQQDTATINTYKNIYLFNSQVAYAELQRKLEAQYIDYYQVKYDVQPETPTSLESILSEDEILLEYVLSGNTIFCFSIIKDAPLQMQSIPLNDQTLLQIDSLNQMLKNSSLYRKSSRSTFIRLSHSLYKQFVAPMAHSFSDKTRLIVISDGIMNYIPFEVLLSSPSIKPFNQLDFLIKNYEVSYHYSANLFAKARRTTSNFTPSLFAFAPVYEKTETENTESIRSLNTSLRAITEEGYFSPLPESEKEVKDIAQLFKQKSTGNIKIALRGEATENMLKHHLDKSYQFIHIAGHSFADLDNPKFSGIACFQSDLSLQDTSALKDDGILYTGEIYNINTQADLVTLSSCESGYGKLENTEGLLGLNRAFIYAGTPNVIFSLWKVYDKVSAEIMIDFYRNVLQEKNYSQSLRQAKLKLLNDEKTASPHYWSPYLLIGR